MLEFQKAEHQRSHLYELKTFGQKTFSTLCELSPKLSSLHRDPNDIKPLLQVYRTIASNLSLELKKYDIKAIAKCFWKLFEDLVEIINGFLIGKLLPPTETLMNTDHWDVDTYLNKKLSKICEAALENVDEVGNTANKAEMELVEVMESLNRQLSSIGAVNYEDIQYMNFEEMILGELEEIYKRGKRNQMLAEKGRNKLHNLILKILQAEQQLRRKFGHAPATKQQSSQTVEPPTPTPPPPLPPAPELKSSLSRIATKPDEQQIINLNQQKQLLQMKIDNLQMFLLQKDLDVTKLKSDIEKGKKEAKTAEQKLKKEFDVRLKEMEKPEKVLGVEKKVVDLKLLIVVSEKMIPLNEKPVKVVEKKFVRNIMTVSEGRNSVRRPQEVKNVSRQSSIELNSKESQGKESFAGLQRRSVAIVQKVFEMEERGQAEMESAHNKDKDNDQEADADLQLMKTSMVPGNASFMMIRSGFSSAKIKKKEIQNSIKIKNWRTNNNDTSVKLRPGMKPAKIEFKIQGDDENRDSMTTGQGLSFAGVANTKKQNKENVSFFTVIPKTKRSTAPGNKSLTHNTIEPGKQTPSLFSDADLELFGGKQGAQKFQVVKTKLIIHNPIQKHLQPNQQSSQPKPLQKNLVEIFESLRGMRRKNLPKYNKIIGFLRFPYSFMKAQEGQVWQRKEDENDIGFKELKGIVMRLVEMHKECKPGVGRVFCTHFQGLFSKIGFEVK